MPLLILQSSDAVYDDTLDQHDAAVVLEPLSHMMCSYSPFISRLLAEDAGSRGGDQRGGSSYSSLRVCLHHGGDWLGGAECAADGARNKTISQNNP